MQTKTVARDRLWIRPVYF